MRFDRSLQLERLEGRQFLSAVPAFPPPQHPAYFDAPLVVTGNFTLKKDMVFDGTAFIVDAPDVTIDFAGHTVRYNTLGLPGVDGIHLFTGSWAAPDAGLAVPNDVEATNCTIENGTLIQGNVGNQAANCNGIGAFEATALKVDNMHIRSGGQDSSTIHAQWGDVTITNSVLVDHVISTFDRWAGPANVKAPVVRASGNVIIGGNSGINATDPRTDIENNVISETAFASNGYGVWLYAPENVTVKNNLILPTTGRGMLLNGGNPADSNVGVRGNNVQIINNVILARDVPNAEFGYALDATGIRLRYYSSGDTITGNQVLAIGGKQYCGASGLYLSDTGPGDTADISGNTFTAILTGSPTPDQAHYAKGITLEGNIDASGYAVDRNTIQSNEFILSTSGWDGSGSLGRPMVGNTLGFLDGSDAVANFVGRASNMLSALGLAANQWAAFVVNSAITSLASAALAPIQPIHATWYSGYIGGDEHLVLQDSILLNGASLTPQSVFVENPQWEGHRRLDVIMAGQPAYWIGRRHGAAPNEPYTEQVA